jgi:hypothetical protein
MVTHDQAAIHQCTQCAICIDGNVRFDENHTFAPAVMQVEALSLGGDFASSERVEAPLGEA